MIFEVEKQKESMKTLWLWLGQVSLHCTLHVPTYQHEVKVLTLEGSIKAQTQIIPCIIMGVIFLQGH